MALALVLGLTALTLWVPRQARASSAAEALGGRIIVSMGDSYSSGEGIPPFYGQDAKMEERSQNQDWLAHRSEKSWPGKLGLMSIGEPMAPRHRDEYWFFVAASGATTADIKGRQNKDYDRDWVKGSKSLDPQIDVFKRLEEKGLKADYVTLTLGGNDAGFANVVTEAYLHSTYLNTSKLSSMLSDTWKKFYKKGGIRDDLKQAYRDIAQAAGDQACIIVAGYPRLLEPSGKGVPMSKDEAQMIDKAVDRFNGEIEKLVKECASEGMNICFVSVKEEFEGHEAYSDHPYINKVMPLAKDQDLKFFQKGSAYSMHPNEEGAKAYARCVQRKLEELEGNRLSGSVAGADDPEAPLDFVTIELRRGDRVFRTTTAGDFMNELSVYVISSGGFWIEDVPAATLEMTVSRAGYEDDHRTVEIEPGHDLEIGETILLQPKPAVTPVNASALLFGNEIAAIMQGGWVRCEAYSQLGTDAPASWKGIAALYKDFALVPGVYGLKWDGTVVCSDEKNFGYGALSGWTDIVMLAPCSRRCYGLKADGSVIQSDPMRPEGVALGDEWTHITQIAPVNYYGDALVGLKRDGTVVSLNLDRRTETAISAWRNIVSVSAAGDYIVGIRANGTVVRAPMVDSVYMSFDAMMFWDDLVKVVGNGDYVAGLRADGTVVVATEEYTRAVVRAQDVEGWRDVVDLYISDSYEYDGLVGILRDGSLVFSGVPRAMDVPEFWNWESVRTP